MADYEAPFEGTAAPARRRPSRVRSAGDAPHSTTPSSAGTDDGDSKVSKTSRRTLKKALKSHTPAAPEPIYEEEDAHWEDDAVGRMPSLGQIPEGHDSTVSKSRSSTAGLTRRRHSEDSNSSRMRARPKQGSLGRHPGSLAKHSNSSLTSVFSGLTQPSTASESNTTITEKSQRDERRRKERSTKGKVKRSKRSATPSVADTEVTQSEVFQFLEDDPQAQDTHSDTHSILQTPSPSVTSSLDSRAGDKSSDASQSGRDTPRTSPTSTRRSHSHGAPYFGQYQNATGKPLYASSFVHGPGDEPAEDSEQYSDEESTYDGGHAQHPSHSALYFNYPPGTNSHAAHPRHGHVLQSPQPHHNVPYAGVMSPHMQPAVPFSDPRTYPSTSPTNFSTTASQAAAWPPNTTFPPPLAIAYSPESAAAYPYHSPVGGHAPPSILQSPVATHAVAAQHMTMIPQHPVKTSPGNDKMIGYELLAHKLSELKKGRKDDGVVPAYRKFEQLNHRVLLHLQDEISELEEELSQLDQEVAEASPGAQTGHRHPASRRGDTQFGNDLHRQRLDVLGRVFLKLEQYNKALSAFNDVKHLPSARPSDVEKYRAWMKQRNPIHEAESRFLERQADLVTFSSKRHTSIDHSVGSNQHAAMWLPLLPFVAFSIVPSLLGRIVVIALISAAGLRMVTSTPEYMAVMTAREWMYAASIYFGLMSVLAVFVR